MVAAVVLVAVGDTMDGHGRSVRPPAARFPEDLVTAVDTPPTVSGPVTPRGWRRTVANYVSLTKPRIIELLLVTTVPVMFLAARGVPDLWLVVATLVLSLIHI